MQEAVKRADNRLGLPEILDWLVEDKLVGAEPAAQLKKERRYYRGTLHPLAIVAEQKWKNGAGSLTLDYLSEWLAAKSETTAPSGRAVLSISATQRLRQ